MSDREREIFSERYEQSVYDCDPYPALLVQAKLSLEQAKRGEGIPPWGVQEICIAESEKAVAHYEAKIAAGILTLVQDLEAQRIEREQAEQEAYYQWLNKQENKNV
jgi:hypothetical protein